MLRSAIHAKVVLRWRKSAQGLGCQLGFCGRNGDDGFRAADVFEPVAGSHGNYMFARAKAAEEISYRSSGASLMRPVGATRVPPPPSTLYCARSMLLPASCAVNWTIVSL